jgi:hypothetical protein
VLPLKRFARLWMIMKTLEKTQPTLGDKRMARQVGRRGFLKGIAALLPVVAATNVVDKQAYAAPPIPKQKQTKQTTAVAYKPPGSAIKPPSMLKGNYYLANVTHEFFCDCPAERGTVVELIKFESDMQGGQYSVVRPGSHSGQPIGIIMNDVVQIDLRHHHINHHKDEVQVGGKVTILQDGWIVAGSFDKPVQPGEQIYYNTAGRLTTEPTGKPIGIAMSSSDADGFVKVKINLYVNTSATIG